MTRFPTPRWRNFHHQETQGHHTLMAMLTPVIALLIVLLGTDPEAVVRSTQTGGWTRATNVCVSYAQDGLFQGAEIVPPASVSYLYVPGPNPGTALLQLPNQEVILVEFLGISRRHPPDGCLFVL